MIIEKVIKTPSQPNGFIAIRTNFCFQNNFQKDKVSAIGPMHSIELPITVTSIQADLFDQLEPNNQIPCPCCGTDVRSSHCAQSLEMIREQQSSNPDIYKYQTVLRVTTSSKNTTPFLRVHLRSESN